MNFGEDLMVAIAYGDAFGLPFEKSAFVPNRKVEGLMPVMQNPFLGRLPKGTWSDDTHLSLATALSLIWKEFDIDHIARCHVQALNLTERAENTHDLLSPAFVAGTGKNGWGKGTTTAVRKLRDGVSPAESGNTESLGNGVLMKIAPLVYWWITKKTEISMMLEQIEAFTRMTHDNEDSFLCSRWYAEILWSLKNGWDPLSQIYDIVYENETELLEATPRRGFTASETLAVALYYFLQEPRFPDNIKLAVRYGGDADSICSVLGVMSVFNGTYQEPLDAQELYDYWRLRYVGRRLDESLGLLPK